MAVDDCGTSINPTIVEGQVHGGIAQGIAEAMYEEAVYDENGVLMTSSMSNYRVPVGRRASHVRPRPHRDPVNDKPLGVKGIGEAGTIASPPAVVNATIDALVSPRDRLHRHARVSPNGCGQAITECIRFVGRRPGNGRQTAAGSGVGSADAPGGEA